MRTIALANQKGGVGKTTTAVNLGAGLSRLHRKVLLIDIDPQANLTSWAGIDTEAITTSIYDLLVGDARITDVVFPSESLRLDVVPSHIGLSGIEFNLYNQKHRETILKRKLSQMSLYYDYILIDCPPSLGILTVNALAAAEEIFIPIQTKVLSLNGLVTLLKAVDVIKERLNPGLEITAIIACMFDSRTNLSKEVVEKLSQHFKDKLFKTIIRENTRLAECPSYEKPIMTYAPQSYGTEDYLQLAGEVLKQELRAKQKNKSWPREKQLAETLSLG